MRAMWDVFCRVIDNHGDLGVCVRLARQLAARGESVRLWIDDDQALPWMAPDLALDQQPRIQCLSWSQAQNPSYLRGLPASKVWIEAFGCELPESFVTHGVAQVQALGLRPPLWVNLEYLSAEPFVEHAHGLPSPVMSGPARGWTKHFFYPGFNEQTGGLLRESDLLQMQRDFDRTSVRRRWLPNDPQGLLVSLFCYEPAGLPSLLAHWSSHDQLWVTPGRSRAAWEAALGQVRPDQSILKQFHALPYTDQAGFDHMLWSCDLNLVRGEDSLIRALWAGQALVWQIYPQHDGAHHAKLDAFLDALNAPDSLRHWHRCWNGIEPGPCPALTPPMVREWQECVVAARQRLLAQSDLLTRLLAWIAEPKSGLAKKR